jgi:hypothetical protein
MGGNRLSNHFQNKVALLKKKIHFAKSRTKTNITFLEEIYKDRQIDRKKDRQKDR